MSTEQQRVWLVTGAGRGLGVDLVSAALRAGHAVVATGRDTDAVSRAVGEHEDLLVVALDVTSAEQSEAAVAAAVERFGRLDVVVNNAGNFYAGFFEELSPAQVQAQIATILFGSMTVTRAALPAMRTQRSGHVVSITSLAGLIGMEWCSAYAAAKFGVEGWMEALATEVEQFGVGTTIVEPGFFRTDLLTPESTTWAELSLEDYAEQTVQTKQQWQQMNGQQAGDPAKLAGALVELIDSPEPPARWVAGADAVEAAEDKARTLLAQIDAYRELSSSLAHDDAPAA